MGQMLSNNPQLHLIKQPEYSNVYQHYSERKLLTLPQLATKNYKIVFKHETQTNLVLVYTFLQNRHVSLNLRKRKQLLLPESQAYNSNGQNLYGYKIKYRQKVFDKIKFVLFKKRIQGETQQICDLLAQMKLLSILGIGPYIGTMLDGTDGYICGQIIEYFVENLVNFKSNTQNLMKKIEDNFGSTEGIKLKRIGYSMCSQQTVLRPQFPQPLLSQSQSQLPTANLISSLLNVPSNSNSNIRLPAPAETRNTKQLKLIDQKTNMLSAIQNYLVYKNLQKAIAIYEEMFKKIQGKNGKIRFVRQYVGLLEDCGCYGKYQEQVIMECLENSQLDCSQEQGQTVNYMRQFEQRVQNLHFSTKQFSSQNQLQQFTQSLSISGSEIKKQKLKLNIQDSNQSRVRQLMQEMNRDQIQQKKHKQKQTKPNQKDPNRKPNKTRQQIDEDVYFQYAVVLMNSGKSRLALNSFQFLLRSDQVSSFTKCKICTYMGLVYYHRNYYQYARNQFQRSIGRMYKIKYYSPALALAFNNIGCTYYKQGDYQRAVVFFNHALSQQCGKNDYQMLFKNNLGVVYMKMGKQVQAKDEFVILFTKGQPVNNTSILCKLYTNQGFMSMKLKQFNKAKEYFKYAIQIQQKCLIPNGYRPSFYLHNNMAMVRFKLREFRPALDHFTKYAALFEPLKSIQGIQVNYNIALAHRQCYKLQGASYYIEKCRRLLPTVPQKYRKYYQKKIQGEADNISRNKIDEVSDESSGAAADTIFSTLSRRFQETKEFNRFFSSNREFQKQQHNEDKRQILSNKILNRTQQKNEQQEQDEQYDRDQSG